jgi:hypothetical protein
MRASSGSSQWGRGRGGQQAAAGAAGSTWGLAVDREVGRERWQGCQAVTYKGGWAGSMHRLAVGGREEEVEGMEEK